MNINAEYNTLKDLVNRRLNTTELEDEHKKFSKIFCFYDILETENKGRSNQMSEETKRENTHTHTHTMFPFIFNVKNFNLLFKNDL